MRSKRYRKPKVKNVDGYWKAQFRDLEGKKRHISLGPATGPNKVSKNDAELKLKEILEPINAGITGAASPRTTFGLFVRQVFLPFKKRKWKEDSTAKENEDRINNHLVAVFNNRPLGSITEEELQDFLDRKADPDDPVNGDYSYSVVDHLRWDLNAIFERAVGKGYLKLNPAAELFTPKNARRPVYRVLKQEDLNPFFSVLDLRERVIGGLALFAGLRPGEIFALKKSDIGADHVEITRRIYRGSCIAGSLVWARTYLP
jgi:integrase